MRSYVIHDRAVNAYLASVIDGTGCWVSTQGCAEKFPDRESAFECIDKLWPDGREAVRVVPVVTSMMLFSPGTGEWVKSVTYAKPASSGGVLPQLTFTSKLDERLRLEADEANLLIILSREALCASFDDDSIQQEPTHQAATSAEAVMKLVGELSRIAHEDMVDDAKRRLERLPSRHMSLKGSPFKPFIDTLYDYALLLGRSAVDEPFIDDRGVKWLRPTAEQHARLHRRLLDERRARRNELAQLSALVGSMGGLKEGE